MTLCHWQGSMAMLPAYKEEAVRRLVNGDACCLDLMNQLAAAMDSLERVQALLFCAELAGCVATALKTGMDDTLVDWLMSALKYHRSAIDGRTATVFTILGASAVGPRCSRRMRPPNRHYAKIARMSQTLADPAG
jgi:DNA-binding FrmR family transcriptional regulator